MFNFPEANHMLEDQMPFLVTMPTFVSSEKHFLPEFNYFTTIEGEVFSIV